MKQILVLIENELEQSITGDILRSGLGAEAEITLTAGAEQAIQQLQSGAVDLFIADVERFDVAHCNMVGGCAADQQEIYLRRLTEHLQRFQ